MGVNNIGSAINNKATNNKVWPHFCKKPKGGKGLIILLVLLTIKVYQVPGNINNQVWLDFRKQKPNGGKGLLILLVLLIIKLLYL